MPAPFAATPPPDQPGGQGAWSVFLSSTIGDLEDLRTEVVDVLQRFGAACDDCRNWVGGYEDVETLCRHKLQQANGYLLLLGHWYGSVQVPGGPSITHIEFDCALDRWKDSQPPYIAVMVPKLNSPADILLQQRAADIVAKNQLDAMRHAEQMNGFRTRVTGAWRKVNFFSNPQELREYALVVCTTWRSGGFMAAAATAGTAARADGVERHTPQEHDLGRLGRGPQTDAVEQALADLKIGPWPALALLAHGNDEAGQRAFMAHLASGPLRRFKPGKGGMRLPHACLDLAGLCAWVAQSLGLPPAAEHNPASVAERTAARLRERPLCLMLDGVGAFDGGAASFHARFWRPFFEQLHALHASLPLPHRLVAVLSDYAGQADAFEGVVRSVDDETTPATAPLLVTLPELGPFTRNQVTRWLAEMAYADEPPGHLAEVVRRVITNDRGELDLIPMKVLDRLRFEPLSPQEDNP